MNKLKKALASAGIALALAVTGGTVADVATSHNTSKAQAYSYTQGPEKWQWDRSGIYCGVWAYVDYNWWEEVFQGKRDGWQRLYWAYC